MNLTVIPTKYAGHAKEYASTADLTEYDALVTMSGDGLLHEVLNGVMARADWQQVISTKQLGIIPCGSGNGMTKTLGIRDVLVATITVVKGHSAPLDLISLRQPGAPSLFGHLLAVWGLIADVDIESEVYVLLWAISL